MSAESLRARLARLRRDGAAAPGDERPDRPEEDAEASAGARDPREAGARAQPANASGGRVALWAGRERELLRAREALWRAGAEQPGERSLLPPADLASTSRAEGVVEARTSTFERRHVHGTWSLDASLAIDREALALAAREPALARLPLDEALFLDTETSGLSGGAGTWVFLVGLGRFGAAGFELWQGFLSDPARERALLAEVAERVRSAPLVVSFFGKAFDRHRLEDKMRQHGIAPPFEGVVHLDLYHPLRRLYAGAFDDLRLATLEHVLAGVERVHDLSGAHAPEAWYDFLAARPHRLERVFAHNQDDVLSLVALAAHLACAPAERRPDGRPLECASGRAGALRALALARGCVAAGRREEAERWLALALERGAGAGEAARARAELAKLAEREGARAEALAHARAALAAAAPGKANLPAGLRRELERRRARLEARA